MRLFLGLCSRSHNPSASISGGTQTPNRPRSPSFSPYQPPTGLLVVTAPRLDSAFLCGLLFVRAPEFNPVARQTEHLVKVIDTPDVVVQDGRADSADQHGFAVPLIDMHREVGCARRRFQKPRCGLAAVQMWHLDILYCGAYRGKSSVLMPGQSFGSPPGYAAPRWPPAPPPGRMPKRLGRQARLGHPQGTRPERLPYERGPRSSRPSRRPHHESRQNLECPVRLRRCDSRRKCVRPSSSCRSDAS